MYRVLLLSLPALLFSCSSGKDADDSGASDTADDAAGGGDGAFVPQEGVWDVGTGISDGACGMFDGEDDDGDEIILTMDEDGQGFTLGQDGDDPEDMVNCTLSGMNFDCDLSDDEDFGEPIDFSEAGLDAVVNMDFEFNGLFSSASSATATHTYNVTCEGADCDSLVDLGFEFELPCTEVVEYPLTAQ